MQIIKNKISLSEVLDLVPQVLPVQKYEYNISTSICFVT